MKNILYWTIEGQTHFGMPRDSKISLVLNERKCVTLHSDSNTSFERAPTTDKMSS